MIKIKSVLFSIIVLLLTIAFFVSPRDNFSENENRSLADFPGFNIDDILTVYGRCYNLFGRPFSF